MISSVFAAVNPVYAFEYIIDNPATAFPTIGTVFLAVTGAEALYADLGHFGRKPIATAWMWIVFPCLCSNYFGQGAFILAHGEAAKNPFFEMFPHWALLPMVLACHDGDGYCQPGGHLRCLFAIAASGAAQSSASP